MLIESLTPEESRVLGTLLEKSLATPDYYPLTLNALRTACNQKSNREPVSEYDDETVGLALAGLKRKCLVVFIPYGSSGTTYKYRHFLEDVRFDLDKPSLAVLAVLLLRGAQTLNEIRMRASSLHPIAANEDAEAVLQGLARRSEPLVQLLPKRPGWKEARWRDVLREHSEEISSPVGEAPAAGAKPAVQGKWEEFAELQREVAELKEAYAALKSEIAGIRAELGG